MDFNWLENSKFKYLITYENRRIYVTWISTQSLSMEYLASWLFLPSQITFRLNIACHNLLVATCLSSLFIHSIYCMLNWLWSESLIGCFKLGLNFIIKSQTKFSRAKLRKCINVMLFTTWIWKKYTIRAISRTSSYSRIINKDHRWKRSACGKHSSKILLFFIPRFQTTNTSYSYPSCILTIQGRMEFNFNTCTGMKEGSANSVIFLLHWKF